MATATETVRERRTPPLRGRIGTGGSGLGSFLVRRFGHLLVVVFACTLIVFLLMQVLGDPVRQMLPLGTSEERIALVRETLGLNDSVLVQYWRFMSNAVTGDFGESLWLGTPALDAALRTVPKTFVLVVPACVIGVALGAILGMWAGMRPGSALDKAITSSTFLLISLAEFWIALILIYLLAVEVNVVATSGYGLDFEHLALPLFVLALRPFAHTVQVMRANVIQEAQLPYVMTARSKGLRDRMVMVRHVLPNAALPVLALAFYDLSRMFIAGTVIEVVFTWPGMGRLAVDALERGDIPLVEATVVLAAIIVAALNMLGDLVTFKLDPRTRSAMGKQTP
jgi:peptide/nickel transport system permease protein